MAAAKKMLPRSVIHVEGANEHNLRNLTVDIPRDQLVVLTGLSGESGAKNFLIIGS